jgi:hypothetical protein
VSFFFSYETQLASFDVLDRYRIEVHTMETAHIHGPDVRTVPGSPEWQYSAHRAKVVFRGLRIPFIDGHLAHWRKNADLAFLYPMIERASSAAYRTVADTDMVELGVDLELDLSAVATSAVCFLHEVYPL